MPEYSIYGIRLRSNEKIPRLTPLPDQGGETDVEVRFEPIDGAPDRDGADAEDWYVWAEREGAKPGLVIRRLRGGGDLVVFYPDGMRFRIGATGESVIAWRPSDLTIEDAAVYLLGLVLGVVLRLRGKLCLHGSAVELGGQALAFVGPSGASKSSTAAALAQLGQRVLSDDLLALDRPADGFRVMPGYPSIRLWPAAVAGLYGSETALPRIVRSWEKRHLDLVNHGMYVDEPLPLAAIYVLDERQSGLSQPITESLSRPQALLELAANTYAGYLPADSDTRRGQFEALSGLLDAVPVRRIAQGQDWGTTAVLARSLRADLVGLSS